MVFFNTFNPFRGHQERSQAPNSPFAQSADFADSTDRDESLDEWLIVKRDQSVMPTSRRGTTEFQRGPASTETQRRPSMGSQRRSSFGEWEVVQDDNNHNVVERLDDCNAPVADANYPEASKKLHRGWHRQFHGLPALDEGEECDDEDEERNYKIVEEEDMISLARPALAHLTRFRDVMDRDEGNGEADFSLHQRNASRNYPSCDNGVSLVGMHKSKSWSSSFKQMFGYRY
ncbi:hypothetical protein FKW77_000218 [Venturia effusa]|uniref:Uncharacterized protein n=1 Tax=Venturia effusa TaxID=50376 RepID=A0A517LJI6_9PEZI|nr:hypothetical protein FKW77_000218 [Venturia effusa]